MCFLGSSLPIDSESWATRNSPHDVEEQEQPRDDDWLPDFSVIHEADHLMVFCVQIQ